MAMRRLMLCTVLALAVAMPGVVFAQQGPYNDKQNPDEYTDAEDGQPIKIVSYFIAPVGYALEWAVARPLHYLATKTSLAPIMSGDTERSEIYNPGPTAEPIEPLAPPPMASSASAAPVTSAPQTYIERTPVGPVEVPAPLAPLTTPPEQPALH
jgi:hypothetical protein